MTERTVQATRGRRRLGHLAVALMAISSSLIAGGAEVSAAQILPPPVVVSVEAVESPSAGIRVTLQSGSPGASYELQRFKLTNGEWAFQTSTVVGPATTSLTQASGFGPGRFVYLVRHVDATGTDTSPWVVSSTADYPLNQTVPGTLQNFFFSAGNEPGFQWSVQPTDIYGVEILRARNDTGTWENWRTIFVTDAYTYNDAPTPDGFYAYLIRPYNAAGPGPWTFAGTSVVNHATATPPTPTLAPPSASGSTVSASWSNVPTETYFTLQRARYLPQTQTWGEWTYTLHGRNVTSATLTNVPDGIYAYVLTANNALGASAPSIQQVTVSSATAIPDAPTSVSVSAATGVPVVTWVDNSSASDGELYFEVQRARLDTGVWVDWRAWAVDKNATSFSDQAVPAGTYAYMVRAHNPIGDSAWVIAQITIP